MLSDVRIRSGVLWFWWQPVEGVGRGFKKPTVTSRVQRSAFLEPQGAVPRAVIISGVASFIVWNLRHPFLGDCRRGTRHFWNGWACVGYSPAPGSWNHVPYSRVCRALDRLQPVFFFCQLDASWDPFCNQMNSFYKHDEFVVKNITWRYIESLYLLLAPFVEQHFQCQSRDRFSKKNADWTVIWTFFVYTLPLLFVYFIKYPLLFYQHLFNHFKFLMKVH